MLVLVKRKLYTCSSVLRWNAEYCGGALGGRESKYYHMTHALLKAVSVLL